MNNNYYALNSPKEKIVKNIMHKFTITNINIILFNSVSMSVMFFDEDDKVIDGQYLIMSGDDYNNWNNDDNYLINWVQKQIS